MKRRSPWLPPFLKEQAVRPCPRFLGLLLLWLATALPAHAREVRVGVYANEPKVFVDSSGQPAGLFVDLFDAIARAEGWTPRYVPCEWQACLDGLNTGRLDLVPDVAWSEPRQRQYGFHERAALRSWSQVYSRREAGIASLFDIGGRRVAVLRGSIQADVFQGLAGSFGLSVDMVPVDTLDQAFAAVARGEADAAIANHRYGDRHAPDHGLVATPIVFQPASLYFAAGKGVNTDLLEGIDRQLARWQQDPRSVYYDILGRWGSPLQSVPVAPWLKWGLAGAVLLLLLSLATVWWLRRQIDLRTRHLRESEQRLTTILDTVEAHIYIKDTDYRYQYANRPLREMIGLPLRRIVGKTDDAFFGPDDAVQLRANDRRVIERGERVATEEIGTTVNGRTTSAYYSVKLPLRREDGSIYALCGVSTDITERKRQEERLRLAATVFQSQESMLVTDTRLRILDVNQAFTEMTGHPREQVLGHTPRLLRSNLQGPSSYRAVRSAVKETGGWQGEIWARRASGDDFPAWLTVTAVRDEGGEVTHYVGTLLDISDRKLAEEEIRQLAFYDALTGLPNRRLMMDRLQHALASQVRQGRTGALLFIDLDHFKVLNDTLGHDVGDQLLRLIAQRLSGLVRKGDTLARLGGDEFLLILEDLSPQLTEAAAQAEAIGRKVLQAVQEPCTLAGQVHHGSCSVGIALFRDQPSLEELLKRADLAMYQAKASGRHTLRFFDPAMQTAITQRVTLEVELREALRAGQFCVHYQPLVSATDGRLTGAEVLVRWQHPQRGLVPPGEFIAVAEHTGLIVPLGCWVLEQACVTLSYWARQPGLCDLTLAVNVSARQFHDVDFVPDLRQLILGTGAPATRLKLEITESLLIDDLDETAEKMAAIQALGVRFSLDDFGTGYSSLAYLKRLPLDQLKIDRSFVRDLITDDNDAAIARTIIALAHSLGLQVVAEGVETEAQRDALREMGCDACQGYLFGRPDERAVLEARLVPLQA